MLNNYIFRITNYLYINLDILITLFSTYQNILISITTQFVTIILYDSNLMYLLTTKQYRSLYFLCYITIFVTIHFLLPHTYNSATHQYLNIHNRTSRLYKAMSYRGYGTITVRWYHSPDYPLSLIATNYYQVRTINV